jgi:membrane protein implicated in regulation of membrane protease activity
VSLAIGTLLSFIFLDPPWRYIVIIPLALWEVFEIYLWLKWRKVRSITGIETFVGTVGKAVTDCDPNGQVRVKGQLWRAHCDEGVEAGEEIVVRAVDGLRLEVAPREQRPV